MLFIKFSPIIESTNLGMQYQIHTTPEEYKDKKLEIGQMVKLDIPSKIADIMIKNDL